MSDAPIITVNKNGPYKVQHVETLMLSDGTQAEQKKTIFLCRCGLSAKKPYCDGSHTREGWEE